MISGQGLTCPKGASLTFEIDMDTGSDLTGATAQWALCESWFDQAKVYLTKTGTGDGLFIGQDGGVWKITVNLAPTDTLDIPSGLLYHDCKVLLQSGDVEDVANGPFSLDPSVNILLTNAPITRNLHVVQLLGRLGQTAPLTVAALARNLLATQSLIGLGQTAAGTVTGGGVSPVFQADFTALTSLPSGLSLSRATTGTYGALQTAATDVARFDHAWNGSAWVATGLLDEEQRTNLLHNSNTFNSADWTVAGNTSVAKNVTGPDGAANSAWTWISTGGVFSEQLYQPVAVAAGSVFSVYVKNGSGNPWLGIQAYDGLSRTTYFQPSAGAVGSVNDGGGTTSLAQSNPVLTSLANGWYRASVTNNGNATSYFILWMSDSDGGGDTVTGTKSLFLFGAGAELGQFTTSYIPTTTAAVTRSADILGSSSPLTGYLAAGPSVWEFQDEATGTIARTAYAAGSFDWPVNKWYRSMGVYPSGTDTSGHMIVGSPY